MVGISPMILASSLANLSSTGSASEGDRHRTMARADSAMERQSARFWPARSMDSSDSRGASGELLMRMTPEVERSRTCAPR